MTHLTSENTNICANILKSHWISHFNIAHLHASKELELNLWSHAPLSQFIYSCAKRESMTCSHSRTSLSRRLLISASKRIESGCCSSITRVLLYSLVSILSFQSTFTTLTCETIENRRRMKAQQEAQIIPAAPRCVVHIEQSRNFLRTSAAHRIW